MMVKIKKGTKCMKCNEIVKTYKKVELICNFCGRSEGRKIEENSKETKYFCPECKKEFFKSDSKEIYECVMCNLNSESNPENFSKTVEIDLYELMGLDIILVSPRHLFRAPFSLHEKTALSSIVLDKDKIREFQITDAKPLKVEVKPFYHEAEPEEAKYLLLQALDWKDQRDKQDKILDEVQIIAPTKLRDKKQGSFQQVTIPNPSEEIFPPCIKLLLKGTSQDGRKRALFVLINFFRSLGLSDEDLDKRINTWNEKNYMPLKKGYIQSQLIWFKRNAARLPPNCDKPNYKDLLICKPDALCRQIKNPLNYAVRKFFSLQKSSQPSG